MIIKIKHNNEIVHDSFENLMDKLEYIKTKSYNLINNTYDHNPNLDTVADTVADKNNHTESCDESVNVNVKQQLQTKTKKFEELYRKYTLLFDKIINSNSDYDDNNNNNNRMKIDKIKQQTTHEQKQKELLDFLKEKRKQNETNDEAKRIAIPYMICIILIVLYVCLCLHVI